MIQAPAIMTPSLSPMTSSDLLHGRLPSPDELHRVNLAMPARRPPTLRLAGAPLAVASNGWRFDDGYFFGAQIIVT